MSYVFTSDLINPDCLNQTTHWFDAKGKEYEISKMSRQHLRGAMNKLFIAFGGRVSKTPIYQTMLLAQQKRDTKS